MLLAVYSARWRRWRLDKRMGCSRQLCKLRTCHVGLVAYLLLHICFVHTPLWADVLRSGAVPARGYLPILPHLQAFFNHGAIARMSSVEDLFCSAARQLIASGLSLTFRGFCSIRARTLAGVPLLSPN